MKLLYDFEIFARQRYGGISRYFFEIIKGISDLRDSEIDVFLGLNKSGYPFDELNNNVKVKKYNYQYSGNLHFLFNAINKYLFSKYVKDQDYDIYHKTYYSDIGLNLPCKLVSTIHDMTHELYPEYFAKTDNTASLKKLSIERSDSIICVSEKTKSDLLNLYNVDPDKVSVIYHGITLNSSIETKKIYDRPYLFYVGQRWGYKNFNVLLSAYAADKNLNTVYDLVCFGGGEFNYSEKLFIKKNNLEKKLIQISGNDSTLASLYKYASLYICTSLYEGFGFPPLEAMKFGCPVLTSPNGSILEVLSDSAEYYEPGNGCELLSKINKILNDPALKAELVKKGDLRCMEFTWQKSIKEHFMLYTKLLM